MLDDCPVCGAARIYWTDGEYEVVENKVFGVERWKCGICDANFRVEVEGVIDWRSQEVTKIV